MLPILPLLILLLLGPANAERLAVEGRLPAALMAVHRTLTPVVGVVAPVEEEVSGSASDSLAQTAPKAVRCAVLSTEHRPAQGFEAGFPCRAGPSIA